MERGRGLEGGRTVVAVAGGTAPVARIVAVDTAAARYCRVRLAAGCSLVAGSSLGVGSGFGLAAAGRRRSRSLVVVGCRGRTLCGCWTWRGLLVGGFGGDCWVLRWVLVLMEVFGLS